MSNNKESNPRRSELDEQNVASLIQDMASFSSSISFILTMGACSKDGAPSQKLVSGREEELSDQIREQAEEITDSIKNIFAGSRDKLVRSSAEVACNSIWDAAALAIAMIDAESEEYDE